jgi:hypothetical protein
VGGSQQVRVPIISTFGFLAVTRLRFSGLFLTCVEVSFWEFPKQIQIWLPCHGCRCPLVFLRVCQRKVCTRQLRYTTQNIVFVNTVPCRLQIAAAYAKAASNLVLQRRASSVTFDGNDKSVVEDFRRVGAADDTRLTAFSDFAWSAAAAPVLGASCNGIALRSKLTLLATFNNASEVVGASTRAGFPEYNCTHNDKGMVSSWKLNRDMYQHQHARR